MASIRKVLKGYRAEVARKGVRTSKVFRTKQAARDWAAGVEQEILHADPSKPDSKMTFGDLLRRYEKERSPKKKGGDWEIIRLRKIQRDSIGSVLLSKMTPVDFSEWRDRRLMEVKSASVLREMQLMSSVLTTARRDWGLIEKNFLSDVVKPKASPSRDRLVTPEELEKLKFSAGEDLNRITARTFHAFLFAIETAMRAGEIVKLSWENVDLESRVAHLADTKNGRPRDVPLTREAVRLLQALPRLDPVFGLNTRQVDSLFRKIRTRSGIVNLTFHDSRHEAITRLAKKLDVLPLARMVGHTDLKMLQVYYNETAANLARRLD